MSLISLDLGEKRVGVAISRSNIIAEPFTTLEYDDKFLDKLDALCREEKIKKIIIGLPKSLSGQKNKQEEKIRQIASEIKNKLKTEIEFIDESFTTKMAEARDKKGNLDEEAAVIILEDYLSSNKCKSDANDDANKCE